MFFFFRELAPRAGLEPATLRLTGWRRCSFSRVLRWFSRRGNLLLPGIRVRIVRKLFTHTVLSPRRAFRTDRDRTHFAGRFWWSTSHLMQRCLTAPRRHRRTSQWRPNPRIVLSVVAGKRGEALMTAKRRRALAEVVCSEGQRSHAKLVTRPPFCAHE